MKWAAVFGHRVRAWSAAGRRLAGQAAQALRQARAELLVATAILSGWAFLTAGVHALAWGTAARAVWPISTGLLLLSASGWGFLLRIAVVGLYVLDVRARTQKGG